MSSRVRLAEISDRPLSVDRLLGLVSDRGTGGIAIFVGVVREMDSGEEVSSLDYTQHPSASSRAAGQRGDGSRRATTSAPSPWSIGSGTSRSAIWRSWSPTGAVHRGPALEACRALIDDLKQTVPIWKEQHLTTGGVTWVGLP